MPRLLATPFSLQCHLPPVFLAHCPPVALPFVSAYNPGLLSEAQISCLVFEKKQHRPSLTVNGCFH